jgi:hypothetical protein
MQYRILGHDSLGDYEELWTAEQILAEHWLQWTALQSAHFGYLHPQITPELCVQDWCELYGAEPCET